MSIASDQEDQSVNAVDLDSETDLLPVGSSSSASLNEDEDVMAMLQSTASNEHDATSTDTNTDGVANGSGIEHIEFKRKSCCITLATLTAVVLAKGAYDIGGFPGTEAVRSGHTVMAKEPAADIVDIDLTVGPDIIPQRRREAAVGDDLHNAQRELSDAARQMVVIREKWAAVETQCGTAMREFLAAMDSGKSTATPQHDGGVAHTECVNEIASINARALAGTNERLHSVLEQLVTMPDDTLEHCRAKLARIKRNISLMPKHRK